MKDWPKPKSFRDIQVFLGFSNFYQQFIQGFSKIVAPLTSMLKTIRSLDKSAPSRNDRSRPAAESNNGNNEFHKFGSDGVKYAKKSRKSKGQKTSKSQKSAKSRKNLSKNENSPNFSATEAGPSFLTLGARKAFNCLRLRFTKTLILRHFDLKCYIWIETDALGYAIRGILSQLASRTSPDRVVIKTNLGQWQPIAFFLKKMIPAEIRYKTYNSKLLAIVKVFLIWRHYLEDCKHEILVLTDHNNLRRFMDTKSLSSRQVC